MWTVRGGESSPLRLLSGSSCPLKLLLGLPVPIVWVLNVVAHVLPGLPGALGMLLPIGTAITKVPARQGRRIAQHHKSVGVVGGAPLTLSGQSNGEGQRMGSCWACCAVLPRRLLRGAGAPCRQCAALGWQPSSLPGRVCQGLWREAGAR